MPAAIPRGRLGGETRNARYCGAYNTRMSAAATLTQAREAASRHDWPTAFEAFCAARGLQPFTLEDLEACAMAAYLIGKEPECRDILAEGYREAMRLHQPRSAARFAYWLSHRLLFIGNQSQCAAWRARAGSILDEYGGDCVERGYLVMAAGMDHIMAGEPGPAMSLLQQAMEIGSRFDDQTLRAAAGHGLGRALIGSGRIAEGMAILDEVMVAATAGEVSPMIVGDLYCGLLEACHELFDIRRAREWTAAISGWCEAQAGLVPYRGPCMVHRVELLRLHGAWNDALTEGQLACQWLSGPISPEGPGDAYYEVAEVHRLKGEFAPAEEAYRQASRAGRQPEPGLALLWLSQGRGEAARAALRRALDEAKDNRGRCAELLGPYVEVLLASGDVAGARDAAAELGRLATALGALLLEAAADSANGQLLAAEGSHGAALAPLRRAWTAWQRLDMPYEAARERVRIGVAYRELGDHQSAAMEFDAARWVFAELGAANELARLDAIAAPAGAAPAGGLTAREVEVLRLVAAGQTNKEIAAGLFISEHTVARHIQNMLTKLGYSSRTALAAFAVEHGLSAGPNGQP